MANKREIVMNKKRVLCTALLSITFTILATDLYLPSLPAITQNLSATATNIKLTLALYLIGYSVSQLFYGPLSDAVGRKKTLLLGGSIAFIGSLICTSAHSVDLLITGRLIQGLGAGAGTALARAMIRDVYEGKAMSRAASIMSNFTALIPFIAPMVGGYIEEYLDWHANFIVLSVLNAFTLGFVAFVFPETIAKKTRHAIHPKGLYQNYKTLMTDRKFMSYSACSFLTYGAMFGYLALSPFLYQKVLCLNAVEFGWLGLAACVGLYAGTYLNIFLLKTMKTKTILFVGICITLTAGILMLIPYVFGYLSVALVIAPFIIYMMACKLIFVNALTLALKELKHIAGTAGALYGMAQALGSAIFTTIAAHIHSNTQLPMSAFFIISGGGMLLIYIVFLKNKSELNLVKQID